MASMGSLQSGEKRLSFAGSQFSTGIPSSSKHQSGIESKKSHGSQSKASGHHTGSSIATAEEPMLASDGKQSQLSMKSGSKASAAGSHRSGRSVDISGSKGSAVGSHRSGRSADITGSKASAGESHRSGRSVDITDGKGSAAGSHRSGRSKDTVEERASKDENETSEPVEESVESEGDNRFGLINPPTSANYKDLPRSVFRIPGWHLLEDNEPVYVMMISQNDPLIEHVCDPAIRANLLINCAGDLFRTRFNGEDMICLQISHYENSVRMIDRAARAVQQSGLPEVEEHTIHTYKSLRATGLEDNCRGKVEIDPRYPKRNASVKSHESKESHKSNGSHHSHRSKETLSDKSKETRSNKSKETRSNKSKETRSNKSKGSRSNRSKESHRSNKSKGSRSDRSHGAGSHRSVESANETTSQRSKSSKRATPLIIDDTESVRTDRSEVESQPDAQGQADFEYDEYQLEHHNKEVESSVVQNNSDSSSSTGESVQQLLNIEDSDTVMSETEKEYD